MDDGPRAIRSLAAASAEPPHASSSDDAAASTFSAHAPTPPKIALCGHTLCGRPVVFEARVRARPAHAAAPASRQQAAPMPTGFYQMLRSAEAHAAAAQTRRQERDRPPIVSAPETRLWVEKYQPKKFTELLAVDQSNVQILRWACQWRDLIAGAGAKTSGPDAPPGGAQPLPKPDRKILLLAGPPGLGKTTLAHVIADAAGFQAVEINASDERSGDAVLGKLKAAITSDSMLPGHKPNLVIIDEIDGALGAAHSDKSLISYLAQLAATPAAHRSSAEADEKRPKTGGTRAQPALRRPIVCICNDLYAPALKPLRTAALVLVLPLRKPNAALLAARLRRICEEERVRIDGKALLELVDLMDCDMRASLHALHFIARSPTLPQSGLLTANNIGRALSGFRDVGRSTGSVYESIFHAAPRASKTADSTLLAHITGHGEYDRLAVGVFELYLQTKFYDDTRLGKVNAALASLAFSDLCSAPVGEERLSAYQPYALLQVHRSFASPVPTSLPFPRADYHRSQQLADNLRVLQSYARGLPPAVQAAAALAELAMERIPALLAVIEPRLRVVSIPPAAPSKHRLGQPAAPQGRGESEGGETGAVDDRRGYQLPRGHAGRWRRRRPRPRPVSAAPPAALTTAPQAPPHPRRSVRQRARGAEGGQTGGRPPGRRTADDRERDRGGKDQAGAAAAAGAGNEQRQGEECRSRRGVRWLPVGGQARPKARPAPRHEAGLFWAADRTAARLQDRRHCRRAPAKTRPCSPAHMVQVQRGLHKRRAPDNKDQGSFPREKSLVIIIPAAPALIGWCAERQRVPPRPSSCPSPSPSPPSSFVPHLWDGRAADCLSVLLAVFRLCGSDPLHDPRL